MKSLCHKGESSWSDFFAFEKGVISISLKRVTIIFSIIADLGFLYFAWSACTKG